MPPESFIYKDSRFYISTVIQKYMAQSPYIGSHGHSTNIPFGICAIYFDLKVNLCLHA